MGKLGLGLLGAAVGAGQTLTNEYENINEEKRLVRREDRTQARATAAEIRRDKLAGERHESNKTFDEDFVIRSEERREDAAKRSEQRALENKRKGGIIDNQLKMDLSFAEDKYAMEQIELGTDIATIREEIKSRRDVKAFGKKEDIKTDALLERKAKGVGPDSPDRIKSTSEKTIHLTAAQAQKGFNTSIANVTGFENKKEAIGDRDPLITRLNKERVELAEIYADPEDRAQLRAEYIYQLADDERTQLNLDAQGKKITSEDVLDERAANIAETVDTMMGTLETSLQSLHSNPPEAYQERYKSIAKTDNLSVALVELEKMQKERIREQVGDIPDSSFQAMWKPYIRSVRKYVRGN